MQRFARIEDFADLEQLGTPEQSSSTGKDPSTSAVTSMNTNIRPSTGSVCPNQEYRAEQERIRQYIDANTTYLNSADAEGSGYIPSQANVSQFAQSHIFHHHHIHSDEETAQASKTPIHYPSSLAEDDNYSLPSSPSLGYYSHTSCPSSRTGFWVDQDASSLNLIMPSSAMFAKGREPTADGDKLGFVKMMITGKSRVWHSRLIREMFKWDAIIANDFEDEFLHEHRSPSVIQNTIETDQLANTNIPSGPSNQPSTQQTEPSLGQNQERYQGVTQVIVERYASSMILPSWARAGLDEQDMQHEILIKNIWYVLETINLLLAPF
ncbi:hypothetical protein BGX27_008352 [Mortierella sp. AM989]|nr:hypothetical protein BGX27_008352 [Mortierella sp. AM989]